MSLPKYDCASHPSTLLDPTRVSPLDSNHLYILSVYDQKRVPADEFSIGPYDSAGWTPVGLARFNNDDGSFNIADHKILTADWNEALHTLSWSDNFDGTGRVPIGSIQFSDDLQSFLGIVISSDGQKRTISGLIIAGYHTKRARKGGIAFDSYDFFYGAVRYTGGAPELEPLCQLWDPDNYDDDEDHGFMYDVSSDAHFTGGIGSNYVKPRGTGEYGYVSFDIKFNGDLKKFEGTFSNDNEKTTDTWTGTSFEIPADIRKLIEDRLKNKSTVAPSEVRNAFVSHIAQESDSGSPSYAVDIYLPAASPDNPPSYTPGVFFANVASEEPSMSELKLWQISSIRKAKDEMSGEFIATDIVQDYVGKASYKIFVASLPNSVKAKFQFTDPYLQDEEKAIMKKYAEFNGAASIPFFAQALYGSATATSAQKNQFNEEKIKAWFSAMGSLQPPTGGEPDPVVEAGLKRDANLRLLQDAYSGQMDDLYKLYYKLKVSDFHRYCLDQPTAQTWFDKLKAYVESDMFVRQWVSWNSDINFKDGSRHILEASVKFNILEDIGYPTKTEKDRQSPDIVKNLASKAAMASFSTSINYDPSLETVLQDVISDVGNSTEEEIKEKYADSVEEYKQIQILLQAYGGTSAFSDWFLKVSRHYGAEGKESFVSSLQLAGSQITEIWNKIAKGKSKEEVIAQFGKTVFELAEEPMKDPAKWKKNFNGLAEAVAASAVAIIVVAANKWDAVDIGVRVYLGLEAFKYALKGLKLFASTALGKLIKTHLLDNKVFLQRVGEWFTEKGVPKDIPGTSILGKLVGKNVKVFLERFGAVLAVASVVFCAFDFKNALESGKPMDIASSAISLVLAIIDVAVVATGIVAKIAGASAVAACAGPIGLAITVIGLVVAIIFFILELSHPDPTPDPIQKFIDDELGKYGFKK